MSLFIHPDSKFFWPKRIHNIGFSYHNEAPEMADNFREMAGIAQEQPSVWQEGNLAEQIYQVCNS
jgi:hypothetical protein